LRLGVYEVAVVGAGLPAKASSLPPKASLASQLLQVPRTLTFGLAFFFFVFEDQKIAAFGSSYMETHIPA
jgi:hypothetical protein